VIAGQRTGESRVESGIWTSLPCSCTVLLDVHYDVRHDFRLREFK
jgi:hypothetical protein